MFIFKCFTQNLKDLVKKQRGPCYLSLRQVTDVSFEDSADVSPNLIKRTLTSNQVSYEEGYTCFIINCPECHRPTKPSTSTRLYINKMTGT